jgi:hypothetical protein
VFVDPGRDLGGQLGVTAGWFTDPAKEGDPQRGSGKRERRTTTTRTIKRLLKGVGQIPKESRERSRENEFFWKTHGLID